jgi:nitroreductase
MNSEISNVIRTRRTIGSFRPELPPAELVEWAIECASWAPNHKKTEPWRVYWLGPETANAIVELNTRTIMAKKGPIEAETKKKAWSSIPGWLVVTSVVSNDAFRAEEDYAACCCFVQNLMLALWSKEIGTKWSTGDVTREPEFRQLIGIDPVQERVVGLIWYGYPAVLPEQSRQPIVKFVQRLK